MYFSLLRRNLKFKPVTNHIFYFAVILAILFLSGCGSPNTRTVSLDNCLEIRCTYHSAGKTVDGRSINYNILGSGEETVFIMSTIHGDEPAGTQLVLQLEDYLKRNCELLQARKVILMPVANPDGMANNLRTNIRGVDLNRNFEARNRKNIKRYGETPLSEPESRALKKLILEYEPARILTIHQPFGCIDYDGDAAGIAERMGQFCELPVEKVGAMPGSLGSFAGIEMGIPIITLELKENDHLLDDRTLWEKYGKALLAFVTYPENF